jgi:hypothetical protein
MKIWKVNFKPLYPVLSCLIIAAPTPEKALELAEATCTHTQIIGIEEVDISKPCIVLYESGDY